MSREGADCFSIFNNAAVTSTTAAQFRVA